MVRCGTGVRWHINTTIWSRAATCLDEILWWNEAKVSGINSLVLQSREKMKLSGSSATTLDSKFMSEIKRKTKPKQPIQMWPGPCYTVLLMLEMPATNRARALLPLLGPKRPSPGEGTAWSRTRSRRFDLGCLFRRQ